MNVSLVNNTSQTGINNFGIICDNCHKKIKVDTEWKGTSSFKEFLQKRGWSVNDSISWICCPECVKQSAHEVEI